VQLDAARRERTIAELVQAVAPGEGYERAAGLAYRKDGVPVTNAARMLCFDLDQFQPAWDLVDWPLCSYRPSPDGRLAIVSLARGCMQQGSLQEGHLGRGFEEGDRRHQRLRDGVGDLLRPGDAGGDHRRYNLVEPVMKPDSMTLAELHGELRRATGHFFCDKFKNLSKLTPGSASSW
jgi:hypothetical protein